MNQPWHLPQEHWRKVWSTNPLERLNKEIRRRTNVVGIFPNDAANIGLVATVLLEKVEDRRMCWPKSMAEIPALHDLPAQACLLEAAA